MLALLYLFIPIFIIIAFSFNDNQGRFNFTWQGFTLRHWAHPFADPDLAKALTNSVEIALISTAIATALGTFMAMALVRYRFRGRSTVDFFVFMPLSSPEVVLGAALLAMFLTINFNTGFVTIVIAHVMFTVSYVVVTVKARLEGMDRHIEEAAMDLGATEWTTFRKVTLPLIAPGVAAAAMLAAAISFDDYVITSFNAGQTQTFPLFIFGATRQGVPAEVNVLATMLLIVVLALMGLNLLRPARAQPARPGARRRLTAVTARSGAWPCTARPARVADRDAPPPALERAPGDPLEVAARVAVASEREFDLLADEPGPRELDGEAGAATQRLAAQPLEVDRRARRRQRLSHAASAAAQFHARAARQALERIEPIVRPRSPTSQPPLGVAEIRR